jgi:hypothetical protein
VTMMIEVPQLRPVFRRPAPEHWPGWPLHVNAHGDEFDLAARLRMVEGGRLTLPTLTRYASTLGASVLEIGPFFNPLLVPLAVDPRSLLERDACVTYWENDPHAAAWLRQTLGAKVVDLDLHSPGGYTSVVASQVLNYVDHRKFLRLAAKLLSKGGLLFINNVVDYGLPELFSPDRPRSDEELSRALVASGFACLEKEQLESPRPGEHPRTLWVCQTQKATEA